LLAKTTTGTPWFSGALAVLANSILASSILSPSTESNTKIIPAKNQHLLFAHGTWWNIFK
jgi:hypothetical protein